MSLLCVPCDEQNAPPQSYEECKVQFRKFGFSRFALVSCDYEFTDITDPTEWEAAITAGSISKSPTGILSIAEPDVTSFAFSGCGLQATGEKTYNLTFNTYSTKGDLGDHRYWDNIDRNHQEFRLIPVDCNGIFYLTPEWIDFLEDQNSANAAAVGLYSPGHAFSITSPPTWVEGEGSSGQWQMTIQIISNRILTGVELPGVDQLIL